VCLPAPPGGEQCQCANPNKTPSPPQKVDYEIGCRVYGAAASAQASSCKALVSKLRRQCASAAAVLQAQADRFCKLAEDPSDPNFMVIAQPQTPTLPGQPFAPVKGESQAEVDALNAVLQNEEEQVGLADALLTTINRAQGAFDAGSAEWIDQQNQAAADYAGALMALMAAEPGLRAAAQGAFLRAGVQPLIAPDDVAASQAALAKAGLPDDLSAALGALGFDAGALAAVLQQLLAADPAVLAALHGFPEVWTDPSLDGANAAAAGALAEFAGLTPPTTTTTTTLPPGDALLSGDILTLTDDTNPAKQGLSALSKDPAIGIGPNGSSDDPTVVGGSLRLRSGTFDVTYALPSGSWGLNGSAGEDKGYKFKSSTGPIASVTLKPGKQLKVKGKGGLGTPLASDPRPIDVVVQTGTRRYCAQFGSPDGGAVTVKIGKQFEARNAPPPRSCPP